LLYSVQGGVENERNFRKTTRRENLFNTKMGSFRQAENSRKSQHLILPIMPNNPGVLNYWEEKLYFFGPVGV